MISSVSRTLKPLIFLGVPGNEELFDNCYHSFIVAYLAKNVNS